MNAFAFAAPGLTIAAYALGLALRSRHRAVYTTPVFVSVALVLLTLAATRVPVAAYARTQGTLTSFLSPACAALGVMCFKHRRVLAENALAIALGLMTGTVATIASAVALARLLNLPRTFVEIEAIKSVTAPVALQLAGLARVNAALTVAFVLATGMVGATFGPAVLWASRVRDPIARGIALGCVSHGIGTAQAASESELSGAAGSLAMCAVAAALSLLGMPLLVLLHR